MKKVSLVGLVFALCFSLSDARSKFGEDLDGLRRQAPELKPSVLRIALGAYHKIAQLGLPKRPTLTIVDYSLPSTKNRIWIIDIRQGLVKYQGLVTHGRNNGLQYPSNFSNRNGSHSSSLGTYLTGRAYYGQHGYSLRLKGLERGFNDNAEERQIVVHGAPYATPTFAKDHGYLGRSWGCFVLDPKDTARVIDYIKDGTVLMTYYPDKHWLRQSQYL